MINLSILLLALFAGDPAKKPLQTGFLVIDGVFNSELMAPFDILQHSAYRDRDTYFRCFLVSPEGKPIKTAEGLTIHTDFSFASCPRLDVLVIPSTLTSMKQDLQDGPYMNWVRQKVDEARVVITLCDGAFPLANTGKLNGLHATTFPGDQERLAEMFPEIKVLRDPWFVQDAKFITSVGGARSYEPALYLAQQWFDLAYAQRLAQGLVIDWTPAKIPHKTFDPLPGRP